MFCSNHFLLSSIIIHSNDMKRFPQIQSDISSICSILYNVFHKMFFWICNNQTDLKTFVIIVTLFKALNCVGHYFWMWKQSMKHVRSPPPILSAAYFCCLNYSSTGMLLFRILLYIVTIHAAKYFYCKFPHCICPHVMQWQCSVNSIPQSWTLPKQVLF